MVIEITKYERKINLKVFIDTALDDLVIVLFDNHAKKIDYKIIKNLKQKSEFLPIYFNDLLKRNNVNIKEINEYYINLGPGTFTGSRIALVFARTICQVYEKASLYTTSTFNLASININKEKNIFIDARGNSYYKAKVKEGKLLSNITIVTEGENQKIDYDFFINNFANFSFIFKEEKDLLSVQPIYVKKPHIG